VSLININIHKKPILTERTEPGLVAVYDIRSGNGAGLFLKPGVCTWLMSKFNGNVTTLSGLTAT